MKKPTGFIIIEHEVDQEALPGGVQIDGDICGYTGEGDCAYEALRDAIHIAGYTWDVSEIKNKLGSDTVLPGQMFYVTLCLPGDV